MFCHLITLLCHDDVEILCHVEKCCVPNETTSVGMDVKQRSAVTIVIDKPKRLRRVLNSIDEYQFDANEEVDPASPISSSRHPRAINENKDGANGSTEARYYPTEDQQDDHHSPITSSSLNKKMNKHVFSDIEGSDADVEQDEHFLQQVSLSRPTKKKQKRVSGETKNRDTEAKQKDHFLPIPSASPIKNEKHVVNSDTKAKETEDKENNKCLPISSPLLIKKKIQVYSDSEDSFTEDKQNDHFSPISSWHPIKKTKTILVNYSGSEESGEDDEEKHKTVYPNG